MPYPASAKTPYVCVAPPELIERQFAEWPGLRADVVAATERGAFDYRFKGQHHLLVASEQAERDDGETTLEATYRWVLTDWLSLQPDLQYVVHPGGDPALGNALVVGLRLGFTRSR